MVKTEEYAWRIALSRRDEQAQWNVQYNLDVTIEAKRAKAWYLGEVTAVEPKRMLSDIVRPGVDGDKLGAHRRQSLARSMDQRLRLDTEAFAEFRRTSYEVLEALAEVRELTAIEEARKALDSFFEYVDRTAVMKCVDEQYSDRVFAAMKAYSEIFERISKGFLDVEFERRGVAPANPYQERQLELETQIATDVRTLTRRAKVAPASSMAVAWVEAQWRYYNENPSALKRDVARRRVSARDVWETVKEVARAKYGIADFVAFKAILNNLRQMRYRARNGE